MKELVDMTKKDGGVRMLRGFYDLKFKEVDNGKSKKNILHYTWFKIISLKLSKLMYNNTQCFFLFDSSRCNCWMGRPRNQGDPTKLGMYKRIYSCDWSGRLVISQFYEHVVLKNSEWSNHY